MANLNNISNKDYEYYQYIDYTFKNTVQKRANGVLEFLEIPYTIDNIILSEIADTGPTMHRLDFAGESRKNGEKFCIILECQSRLPTDEDIKRFFQYVSSLRILKNTKIELYILCTENATYNIKEFVLNDECIYKMHVLSLKHIKASKILKQIEYKITHEKELSDRDIAALELIIYTDYEDTKLEILQKTLNLVERLNIDANEKEAIIYILDVLSANMLEETDKKTYMEERNMMINPRDEYLVNKTREEVMRETNEEIQRANNETKQAKQDLKKANTTTIKNLIKKGFEIVEISEITGLSENQIQKLLNN